MPGRKSCPPACSYERAEGRTRRSRLSSSSDGSIPRCQIFIFYLQKNGGGISLARARKSRFNNFKSFKSFREAQSLDGWAIAAIIIPVYGVYHTRLWGLIIPVYGESYPFMGLLKNKGLLNHTRLWGLIIPVFVYSMGMMLYPPFLFREKRG